MYVIASVCIHTCTNAYILKHAKRIQATLMCCQFITLINFVDNLLIASFIDVFIYLFFILLSVTFLIFDIYLYLFLNVKRELH